MKTGIMLYNNYRITSDGMPFIVPIWVLAIVLSVQVRGELSFLVTMWVDLFILTMVPAIPVESRSGSYISGWYSFERTFPVSKFVHVIPTFIYYSILACIGMLAWGGLYLIGARTNDDVNQMLYYLLVGASVIALHNPMTALAKERIHPVITMLASVIVSMLFVNGVVSSLPSYIYIVPLYVFIFLVSIVLTVIIVKRN